MRRTSLAMTLAPAFLLLNACGNGGALISSMPEVSSLTSASGSASSCPANIRWVTPATPAVNSSVLNYARSNLGRRVGNGQCAELADDALKAAHAPSFSSLGPTGLDADYVWGSLRFTASTAHRTPASGSVLPGDVIQFRNANFKWYPTPNSWSTESADHHTAIVAAVSADNQSVCVLEQNTNGRLYVTYGYYDLAGLQSGQAWFYQPI